MSTRGHHQLLLQVGGAPPGVGHLYWRVRVTATATGDSYFTNILELEMRSAFGGADLCVGGVAAASSFEGTYSPAKAFDNLLSAEYMWLSINASPGPQWLRYQFVAPVDIKQIVLTGGAGGSNRWQRSPRAFEVQWSDDGLVWTTKKAYTYENAWNAAEARTFDLEEQNPGWISPGAFRHFKLSVSANNGGPYVGLGTFMLRDENGINTSTSLVAGAATSASSIVNGSNDTYMPFDENPQSNWLSANSSPAWIKFSFGAGVTKNIKSYSLYAPQSTLTSAPRDFILEGSNDDINWTLLDTRTGQTGWVSGVGRQYLVPSA